MARARAVDAERANGKFRGALHGIPLARKDCFEIQGHAATVGSRARPVVPAAREARVIRLLNDAGAVTVGVLNMSEMVAGPTGQNPSFRDCCNALDPSRISGGSSSGSGSAVAPGAIFASIGSDTGGSIRLPASVHGLFGLKPTWTLLSRRAAWPCWISRARTPAIRKSPLPIPVPLRADADMEKAGGVCNVVTQLTRLTRPFSYLGLPVLSMPAGWAWRPDLHAAGMRGHIDISLI